MAIFKFMYQFLSPSAFFERKNSIVATDISLGINSQWKVIPGQMKKNWPNFAYFHKQKKPQKPQEL